MFQRKAVPGSQRIVTSASACDRRGARGDTTYIISVIDTGVWSTGVGINFTLLDMTLEQPECQNFLTKGQERFLRENLLTLLGKFCLNVFFVESRHKFSWLLSVDPLTIK